MISRLALGCLLAVVALPATASDQVSIDALVARYAKMHGVPEALIHRVIQRESGYNPRAANRGHLGLMQIRHDTARGMGYRGPASGLLDADTNLAYGVPYLANAYLVAGGNPARAISLYSRGYYYEAKRRGLLGALRTAATTTSAAEDPAATQPPTVASWFASVFSPQASAARSAVADR
ncbi:lytic transglycosylase domain-containing protein [Microvirga massiliensis]|uniref:lytic transglycosylase domain-containing protein n=1 Tax=Microvirga massiliensis TaxID=1033741 RepID=UPI0007C636C4|nr:lytic transglycosylase domain-containing protein [Microvirga massiliensis]